MAYHSLIYMLHMYTHISLCVCSLVQGYIFIHKGYHPWLSWLSTPQCTIRQVNEVQMFAGILTCIEFLNHRKGTPKLGDLKIILGRCIPTFPLLTERHNLMLNINKSSQRRGEEYPLLYANIFGWQGKVVSGFYHS